jgi:tetratricopeptide (TPR) repeat protein
MRGRREVLIAGRPNPEETTMQSPALALALLLTMTPAHASDLEDCAQRIDAQRAIDGCTRVLHGATLDDRSMAMVLNNRGNAYGAVGAYDLALADYDQAISIDPVYTHGYFNRGSTYLEAGRLEFAIADFTRALEIDPGLVQAFINRGLAELNGGLYDLAIDDFTAAIALEPHSAIAHNNRGVAHRRKGQLEKAVADFDAAFRIDPDYGTALKNRTDAMNTSADTNAAEADRQQTALSEEKRESIRRNLLLHPDGK